MAQDNKVYPDGAIIFQEGDSGEGIFELISGAVDLLVKRNEKYTLKHSIKPGSTFGDGNDTTTGIRIFTARANGRTVIRSLKARKNIAVIAKNGSQEASSGILNRLLKKISGNPTAHVNKTSKPTYSNPGLIRRLMNGAAIDHERIGIRVAQLSGPEGEKHSKHIISSIGNTHEFQTRSIEKILSINSGSNKSKQLARLANAARQYLAHQGADLLIWGHVSDSEEILHLHFVTHANWDQHTAGAFILETTLALPIDFDEPMANLLHAVCLAAVLPQTPNKRKMRTTALPISLETARVAFNIVPNVFSSREKSCLYLCYGNVIAAVASYPRYDTILFSQAKTQYQLALSNLDPSKAAVDWAQTKKHIASITHNEAERSQDPKMLMEAKTELTEALSLHNRNSQGEAWAILQHRLGLVLYHLGFNDGDPDQLRMALRCFHLALRVYTRDDSPARWAEIMSSFARAAKILGGLQESPDALATAVNAYKSVLEYRDRDANPKAWAASQNNLGSALFLLGKQTQSIERLDASMAAFKSALEVYQQLNATKMAITSQKNLDRANAIIIKYKPRNTTQSDWENALAEGLETDKQETPLYNIVGDDEENLPFKGEVLKSKIA